MAKKKDKKAKGRKSAIDVIEEQVLPRVAVAIPAAVAGAARRKARQKLQERKERKERGGKKRKRVNWAKAARQVAHGDVKKVLDTGVGKADKLLESAMSWIVKLAIRAKSLYDMLSAWWNGKYDLPTGTLQAIVVALLYFISPLDIIPDFLPFIGLADDAAIFAFVVSRIRKDLERYAEATGKSPADLGL